MRDLFEKLKASGTGIDKVAFIRRLVEEDNRISMDEVLAALREKGWAVTADKLLDLATSHE